MNLDSMNLDSNWQCPLCGNHAWDRIAVFDRPQPSEKSFGIISFYRELWQCITCGLFVNRHDHDLSQIYNGAYRAGAYETQYGSRFQKIMNLPYAESDNKQRVRRVIDYVRARRPEAIRLLDIGSGMGVFPAGMSKEGWQVTAVDPDSENLRHLRALEGEITCIAGYFPDVEIEDQVDLITFNKVLEHIEPIVDTLAGASQFLANDGLVYVELPDGEAAVNEGPERQEFFIEHYYAFSIDAIALLARRAGLRVEKTERIKDPSGKYTLYAFMSSSK